MELKTGMWTGKRCFLLGGGPSLKDFNWDLLKNELWIGINAAWLKAIPSIAYTHDKRVIDLFQKRNGDGWKALPCRVHKHKKQIVGHKDYGGILTFEACKTWSKSLEQGLYNGNNSGVTALNLADMLGASPIYLIGFDMRKEGDANHFHDHYPKGWRQPDKVYNNFKTSFKRIKQYIKAEVINLTPNSALTIFPMGNLEEVLKG